jgi:hypothetical protein
MSMVYSLGPCCTGGGRAEAGGTVAADIAPVADPGGASLGIPGGGVGGVCGFEKTPVAPLALAGGCAGGAPGLPNMRVKSPGSFADFDFGGGAGVS